MSDYDPVYTLKKVMEELDFSGLLASCSDKGRTRYHPIMMYAEKNRKRKLTKHKKLSNNTIIEIDNCSPLEILKLQKNLTQIAEQEQLFQNRFRSHLYENERRSHAERAVKSRI